MQAVFRHCLTSCKSRNRSQFLKKRMDPEKQTKIMPLHGNFSSLKQSYYPICIYKEEWYSDRSKQMENCVQNHKVVQTGKIGWSSSSLTSYSKQGQLWDQNSLFMTLFSWVLKSSENMVQSPEHSNIILDFASDFF